MPVKAQVFFYLLMPSLYRQQNPPVLNCDNLYVYIGDRPKGLHLFHEEHKCRKSFVISMEHRPRKISSKITVLPWQVFCERLWAGDIL